MGFGCTSFSWETKDGRHLLGRTYDQFGDLRVNRVIAVQKGAPCAAGCGRAGRCRRPGTHTPAWRCWGSVNPSWWTA